MTHPDEPTGWTGTGPQSPGGPAVPAHALPAARRRGLIVALVAAIVVAAGAGAAVTAFALRSSSEPSGGATASTGPVAVHGTLTLADAVGVLNIDGRSCTGMEGYDDLAEGAQVVVTDQTGAVVGTAQLSYGDLHGSGMTRSCVFSFDVLVPPGRPFYGITVSHRGTIQFSGDQIGSGGVALSIG